MSMIVALMVATDMAALMVATDDGSGDNGCD